MDGFSYTNIFDTKGIEYLIIIGFLILIIPFWRTLNRPLKVKEAVSDVLGILNVAGLRIPGGLLYSRNHVWTHLERSGSVSIGLDDLLMHLTGRIELKNFRKPGERITRGDMLAEIRQGDKHLSILSPVSGEISDMNDLIKDKPAVLNEDPYNRGWLYRLKPERWTEETKDLVMADEAKTWSENELLRFKDFVAHSLKVHAPGSPAVILQEGGELTDHPLKDMPEEVWKDFQQEFMSLGT